jgi:hypothetical protein
VKDSLERCSYSLNITQSTLNIHNVFVKASQKTLAVKATETVNAVQVARYLPMAPEPGLATVCHVYQEERFEGLPHAVSADQDHTDHAQALNRQQEQAVHLKLFVTLGEAAGGNFISPAQHVQLCITENFSVQRLSDM